VSHPGRTVAAVLLPTTCPVCLRLGPAPCDDCAAELRPAPLVPHDPALDGCRALLAYDGAARELVARLKYRNARAALPGLARAMAALVEPGGHDMVTWVPTTTERRRARGYDQAELLARAVARTLRLPCRRLLRRLPGPAQTGRSARERRGGPRLATSRRSVPARLLVVDDVITTGGTVSAAARTLRAAGATRVVALAAAHTPPSRVAP
jgi:ComF family protein